MCDCATQKFGHKNMINLLISRRPYIKMFIHNMTKTSKFGNLEKVNIVYYYRNLFNLRPQHPSASPAEDFVPLFPIFILLLDGEMYVVACTRVGCI